MDAVLEVHRVTAHRDTRCRNCWARIRAGEPMGVRDQLPYHLDCRPVPTRFPVIGSINEDGDNIDLETEDRDDVYSTFRRDRFRRRR